MSKLHRHGLTNVFTVKLALHWAVLVLMAALVGQHPWRSMRCSSGKARAKDIREKEKGKGKSDFSKGKAKGKGKSDPKGKGLGKDQNSNASIVCHYCGKQGHKQKECFKFQRDHNGHKGGGKGKYGDVVRPVQIEEVPEGSSNTEAAASSSSSPPSKPAVRLVERVFDLTAVPESSSSGAVRVVSNLHEMDIPCFKFQSR